MSSRKNKLLIAATLLLAVGFIVFQSLRSTDTRSKSNTVQHAKQNDGNLTQTPPAVSPQNQNQYSTPFPSDPLLNAGSTIPNRHPRWPKAIVQDYRNTASSDSDITIREWILDIGRPDLPIKVVEKVAFEGEPEEEVLSYLEMAANRVLISISTNEIETLSSEFPDTELQLLAENAMILTASTFDLDTVDRLMKEAQANESILFAEPDYVVRPSVVPNDPRFSGQWGLNNASSSGADIDAPQAWDVRRNAASLIVAVTDSGLRTTHEDIRTNLWTNPNETLDGIDNDGNGIIDDVNGFSAINDSNNLTDNLGHGTHVAGIIGAQGNNGLGITGVAWDVQIMALKFLEEGGGSTSDAIQLIDYAVAKGADLINASWGGPGGSALLSQAIARAQSNGIPFVAAAGNDSLNNDTNASFPANFTHDNIVSVGSSTSNDTPSSFSNFGSTSVDVFAPGSGILSIWNTSNSAYQSLSGTSMAAPMVCGALAIIAAQYPQESYLEWIQRIVAGVDRPAALQGLSVSGGRINLNTSLSATGGDLPPVITTRLPNQQIAVGGTLVLSVVATGTEPLSYSWSRNNSAIPGQTGATLTLNNLQIGDSGTYQVLVSNAAGVATSTAEVLVTDEVVSIAAAFDAPDQNFLVSGDAPWELVQNNSVVGSQSLRSSPIADNESSIIQTTVTGPGTLCFWWRVSSESGFDYLNFSINGILQRRISGETSWQQVCADLGAGNHTLRWGYIKDSAVSDGTDAGFLDGFSFFSDEDNAPQIIRQPVSQVVSTGASTSFSVTVESPETPQYQWLKNEGELFNSGKYSDVNSATLKINSVNEADHGLYSVRVINSTATRVSSLAQLTVNDALEPRILTQPEGATIGVSADLTLSVEVDGSAPFTYAWLKDDSPISGATEKQLSITNSNLQDSGNYKVRVTNTAGSVDSEIAEILVIEVSILPVFLKHPVSSHLKAGDTLNLSVSVGGATPRTIKWFKNGTEINGETTEQLLINEASIDDTATYWAEVTNEFGTAKSRLAIVSVLSQPDALIAAINAEGSGITLENTEGPGWFPQSNVTDTDSLAMQSGSIGPLQSSSLTSYVRGPGTLFFRWKVSSQPGSDFLQFRVNGSTIFGIAGEHEWETRSFELLEGINRLDWVYTKSAIVDAGEDAGFLDRIFLSDGAVPHDALSYFPGSADAGNGWIFIPNIEFLFGDGFRWVYHPQHQWWYLFGLGGNETWIYDLGLGWIHLTSANYPSVFSARENAWLFYDIGSTNPRVFINIETQKAVDAGF
ncbi:S8 family serine peptidase [Rubellicoccus peritrichatus]|uniref:S8 family serine peptidase n=1 Tax=Rubellicoccus peritrichatus TaxID=3080537 RepID=A0AAQ3LD49_9BACT|nr:S8 family serine peptidase [Puniceicoccus sp. CR14]WOO42249.1 S8 family serine peptidase [Puniceicoccus sp. CR14]